MASFFGQFNAIGQLFYSFVQHHQLELRTSKRYSKRQNLVQNKNIDVQNLKNIGLLVFFTRIFFGTLHFFLKFSGFHQRVSPSFVQIFCNTMDVKKSQRVPPLTFFDTVTLFKNLILIFFQNFQNQLEFHKAQRVPLLQFWALDIAPTLAVPGLFQIKGPRVPKSGFGVQRNFLPLLQGGRVSENTLW